MLRNEEFIWVEKYRPRKIADCILPESVKSTFQAIVDSGNIQNLILTGSPGVGKTSVARAMCEEIGLDYILINGSKEGIDTLRGTILNFATTVSLYGTRKVVIMDESDNLTSAFQKAFNGVIEEVSKNCTFIFTCNRINRLIDPIQSRCATIVFKLSGDDKNKMAVQFLKRTEEILNIEKVKFDKKVVIELLKKYFPDYRRILNELQKYSISGEINVGMLSAFSDARIEELIPLLKAKNFYAVRQWVGKNSDSDSLVLMRDIYDRAFTIIAPKSIPFTIITLGKYQKWAMDVVDQEINTMAFLTELMCEVEFV